MEWISREHIEGLKEQYGEGESGLTGGYVTRLPGRNSIWDKGYIILLSNHKIIFLEISRLSLKVKNHYSYGLQDFEHIMVKNGIVGYKIIFQQKDKKQLKLYLDTGLLFASEVQKEALWKIKQLSTVLETRGCPENVKIFNLE